jgi:hypothetical protein
MDRTPRTWLLMFIDVRWIRDFIHQGLKCMRYNFWRKTNCPSINFLFSRGDDPHCARVSPPLAPMITYVDFFVQLKNGSNRRFWNSRPGGNHAFVTSTTPRSTSGTGPRFGTADDRNKDAAALSDSVCRRGEVLNEPSISQRSFCRIFENGWQARGWWGCWGMTKKETNQFLKAEL